MFHYIFHYIPLYSIICFIICFAIFLQPVRTIFISLTIGTKNFVFLISRALVNETVSLSSDVLRMTSLICLKTDICGVTFKLQHGFNTNLPPSPTTNTENFTGTLEPCWYVVTDISKNLHQAVLEGTKIIRKVSNYLPVDTSED